MLITFFVCLAITLGAGYVDARLTARGIAKGLFVEGNGLAVKILGTNRPTFRQSLLFNYGQATVLCAFAALSPLFQDPGPFLMISASALIADTARHIQGALKARKYGA